MSAPDRRPAVVAALVAVAIVAGAAVVASDPGPGAPIAAPSTDPAPSPSPVTLVKIGGVFGAVPDREITDPTLLPYPFMSPTPEPEVTEIDGTYLRTLTLDEVGGARIGLPYRCLRCPPYRIDAGVSTLVLHEGAYYLDHQLSNFRTMGSFVVQGDRLTLFNDANCPQTPGVYEWKRGRTACACGSWRTGARGPASGPTTSRW